jgi:hypothetical protein
MLLCRTLGHWTGTKFKTGSWGGRGPFLTSPLGANFDPRGEVVPQGWILSLGVKLSPGCEILCFPLHSSKLWRVFTPGGERRGEHSPQGTNFTPGGEVKNGPQGEPLRLNGRMKRKCVPTYNYVRGWRCIKSECSFKVDFFRNALHN